MDLLQRLILLLFTDTCTTRDWFNGISWSAIPYTFQGESRVDRLRAPLKLLGGSSSTSGKPSKLAALAAARKQKEAQQKENQTMSPDSSAGIGAVSMLDRLGAKDNRAASSKVANTETQASVSRSEQAPKSYPIRKRKTSSPQPAQRSPVQPEINNDSIAPDATVPGKEHEGFRSQPSVFARAMCGDQSHTSPQSPNSSTHNIVFTLYGGSPDQMPTNAFSGPSPDDVVTSAQAKGFTK